jgi:hypothetical protein
MDTLFCPKTRPFFKTKTELVMDDVFQRRLKEQMIEWEMVKSFGVPVFIWWEEVVKKGIKESRAEPLDAGTELFEKKNTEGDDGETTITPGGTTEDRAMV